MSTPDDLHHKIERLAAAGAPAATGRTLRPFGGRSLLAALLVEIDETVLAGRFRVANTAGREILVLAHNRRLLQVRAPDARQLIGQPGSVLWQPSDTPTPEDSDLLRDLLEGFIADGDRLQVYAEPGAPPAAGEDIGVSATRLARDWELALAPPAGQPLVEILDAMLAEHKPQVVTWVRRLDGQTECGGDASLFDQTEALARALERDVFAGAHALPRLSGERCLFTLDRFGKAGHGAILASFEGMLVTLLVRQAGLARLAGDLQQILHGWHRTAAPVPGSG